MDLMFDAVAVLTFAAVILLIEGAWLWWSDTRGGAARRVALRLRRMSGARADGTERVSILKQRRLSTWPAAERWLARVPALRALDQRLQQAGVKWSVAQFLCAALALALAGLLPSQLWAVPGWAGAALPLLCGALPYALLVRARAARLRKIEEQLPETADFLGRALRAGHAFANVLQMVGQELPEPISGEFRTVHEEINYGVPMQDALHNLAARVPLTDLRYLVIAVLIQRESGGNLAEVLGGLGRTIRARLKLLAQVQVMSAEGRLSAWVMGALPLVIMGVMDVINPDYIRVLWTEPSGIALLWYGAGMIVLGVLWMRVVIRIRV